MRVAHWRRSGSEKRLRGAHGSVALKSMAPHVFMAIEQAALRAVEEGIYQHHPGAPDDGCDADFKECIAFEFIVKAHLVWHGFPTDPREFKYQTRAEIKKKAPYVAEVVYM